MVLNCHAQKLPKQPLQRCPDHCAVYTTFTKEKTTPNSILLLPQASSWRHKNHDKGERTKNLEKTIKSTLEMLHLVKQLGYSIYKDTKVLLFSYITKKHTYTPLKLRSSSTSNHYYKVLTSSQTLDNNFDLSVGVWLPTTPISTFDLFFVVL